MSAQNDRHRAPSSPAPGAAVTVLRHAWRLAIILLGTFIFVGALRSLFQPNHLLSGGVAGTSLLLARLLPIPIGLTIALLNVPIFIWGIRDIGRTFSIYSGVAVLATWLMADLIPFRPLTDDPMLAGVFGGLFFGLGSALALRTGGSLGGFDILGVVISRRFGLGVGEVMLALNAVLVTAAGLLGSFETAMYTLVAIYTAGKTVDAIQSPRRRKAFLIMTHHPEQIRATVLQKMNRGMTVFQAEGAYTQSGITALLCVITRQEVRELSDLVRREDPQSFVVVLEAGQVLGSFRSQTAAAYWKRLQDRPEPRPAD